MKKIIFDRAKLTGDKADVVAGISRLTFEVSLDAALELWEELAELANDGMPVKLELERLQGKLALGAGAE